MWMIGDIPKEKEYDELIDLAARVCKEFILVKRPSLHLNKTAENLLNELKPFLVEIKKQQSWPGTELLRGYGVVYYYKLNEVSKELLKKHCRSLYMWRQPILLEDLCFLKEGRKPWLNNVCHEKFSWITNETDDEIAMLKSIKGIKLIKKEEYY